MFARLARVDVQLVMRMLAAPDVLALARTCSTAFAAASDKFAWASRADVVLSARCVLSARSLLRFVPTRLYVNGRCGAFWPVGAHCMELHVDGATFSSDEVRTWMQQPSLQAVDTLDVQTSPLIGWIIFNQDVADASAWLSAAAGTLHALTTLRVTLDRDMQARVQFPRVTELELRGDHRVDVHVPQLRIAYLLQRTWGRLADPLQSGMEELHIGYATGEASSDAWAALWNRTRGVQLLHMRHCSHVNKVLGELLREDGRMPRLSMLMLRMRARCDAEDAVATRGRVYVPLLRSLLTARTDLCCGITIDAEAVEIAAVIAWRDDVAALQAAFPDRVRVLTE
jgi:hypothetical protein